MVRVVRHFSVKTHIIDTSDFVDYMFFIMTDQLFYCSVKLGTANIFMKKDDYFSIQI